MRRTHRLPARFIRWISLSVCFALIVTSLATVPLPLVSGKVSTLSQGQSDKESKGKARKVKAEPPRRGAPSATMPDLDEAKRKHDPEPVAPAPIFSTMRSKRKPLESRRGRKVGDPLPPQRRASTNETGDGSERVSIASADAHDRVGIVRSHHARTTRSLPRVVLKSSISAQPTAVGRVFSRSSAGLLSYPAVNFLRYSAFDFLRKPGFHSYDQTAAVPHWLSFLVLSEESIATDASFDFLVAPIPQAGSSRIVFTSNRDGSMQIYVMNSDGSGQTRLTYNSANDDNPRWSPNGAKILFQSDRDNSATGFMDIYVMNPDGSGQTRLISDANDDSAATWSPDGTKIAFQSLRNGVNYQVYVMNADGSGQVNGSNSTANDTQPSWSPDGAKIAFASDRDHPGLPSVYVMNANGTNQTRLTFSGSGLRDEQPAWSSNGMKLAFASTRDSIVETWQETDDDGGIVTKSKLNVNQELYVMNPDGSGQTRLTNDLANDDSPRWSPDGTKIVFRSDRERDCCDPTAQVWTMNPDGSNPTLLSGNQFGDYSPSWGSTSNQSPVASVCGPYSGVTLQTITFNGGGSFDPDGSIASYAWSFGDGGTGSGVAPTHAYTPAGTYNVTLTVTDNLGAQASATTTATISNQSPVANAGGPYNGTVGQSVSFNGGGSSDPDGSISSYSWNFGDGGTGSGVAPTHAYSTVGTYNVTLTVTDNLGAQGSTTTTASISVPPNNQFVQNFYQWALLRQPTSDESSYWTDIMRAAYPQGQSAMLIVMREFGMTMFESAEYAARNRSDHDYVYDLYKSFLMREPDQQEWDNWTASVPLYGREHVRRGFDESTEFINLVATLSVSASPSSNVSSLMTARVDPFNQPGSGLAARDAEWSVPILSLPGRAGLDLGLSLSYSSMVWTRSGPYLHFDEDNGSLSPGFRLGFPTIQEKLFDAQVSRNVYILLTPGGSRVELRQVGTSNVYEAADSSYLQLIEGGSLLLRTTDGTQLTYWWFNHEFRCVEIKDRNGNYLNAAYDWRGDIANVTDTLGRAITFNYDGNANLISITQTWNGQTHTWATFGWGDPLTMHPNLSGAAVVGTHEGDVIPVLRQVGLDDGSRYNFEYTAAGQVNVIRRYRSDNVQSSYTAYDYQSTANDCPRISQTRVWAENWTGVNGVPSEVVTQFSDPGDGSHVMTAPDGTVYKEFYGSGWQKGLATQSEVWSGGVRQKWTTTAWTQDNTGASYQTNPRVNETNVYDSSGNRRRTVIDYGQYAQYGLPYWVREYASDGTTEVRQTFTDYNLSQAYLDRHIIGLVSEIHLTNVANWQAKLSYGYDDPTRIQSQATTATQHDQSYSASFTIRGNVTSVSRWDVTDINNAAKALTTRMGYNAAGSVLTTADPLEHQSSLGYADSFSDGNNSRNTFAYPTTATDADGNSSLLQYNYDFGGKTRAQGPPPAGQTQGVIQTIAYDSAARVDRVTTTNTGAYKRYVYGPNYVQSFSSVNSVADDAYAIQVFDGAGRVIGAAKYHPGSAGGFSMVNTIYDLMGRVVKQSNPTEINGSWVPSGDDAAGLIYTQQTYDWKGRPLVTTNTDGTQKYANYGGCGCAGGEVVTLTDEVGRQQKVYSDVLGRQWKTEVLNDDDSVYSAGVNVFNARDQVAKVKHYSGPASSDASSTNEGASCPTGTCQESAMGYDGYGRLQSKHVPEQNAGTSTTYAYNTDDTVQSVTDARGASATYSYNNNRHLVTGITYSAPYGIQATPNVSFNYDAAGNRSSMTDGTGSVSYAFDQLSRLTSETRTINGVGTYPLNYAYNLAGELTSLTDPFSAQVGYNYDASGRTTAITGSGFGNVSSYASNLQYRAWGALKYMDYGNTRTLSQTYNSRLQPATFTVPNVMSKSYDYQADGRLGFSHDLINSQWDRSYSYDHAGRITQALSGAEARNEGTTNVRPYKETFIYDAFGHLVERPFRNVWSGPGGMFTPEHQDYQNERNVNWQYDADGSLTDSGDVQYTIDAAGQTGRVVSVAMNQYSHPDSTVWGVSDDVTQSFDGDGQVVKKVGAETTIDYTEGNSTTTTTTYLVRSTVLKGRVVAEISETGQKQRTFVYLGNAVLAWQRQSTDNSQAVLWEHRDAGNASFRVTASGGTMVSSEIAELDPLGANAGITDPISLVRLPKLSLYPGFGDTGMSGDAQCILDGTFQPCSLVFRAAAAGGLSSMDVPWNISGTVPNRTPVRVEDPATYDPNKEDPNNPQPNGIVTIYEHYHYEWVPTGDVTTSIQSRQPQNPGLSPVGTGTSGRLENARAKLHFTLEEDISEDCQKSVLDKLPGLSVRGFLTYLNRGGNFYNAETSTATVAGNVGTLAWANASYGQGATFSGVFSSHPGTMALSSMVNSTFTVFLRERYVNGMNGNQLAAFLFHEALHGYGQGSGLFDDDLKDAFRISRSDPTSRISDYIEKHCFAKKKK